MGVEQSMLHCGKSAIGCALDGARPPERISNSFTGTLMVAPAPVKIFVLISKLL
jgi:hypothetical protein